MPSLTRKLSKVAPLHIMLHELWIGPHKGASIKQKIEGYIQKKLLSSILKKASCIHTSNWPYQQLIQKENFSCELLPLFSTIPVEQGNIEQSFLYFLQQNGIPIDHEKRSECWIFCILGSIAPEWHPGSLFKKIAQAAKLAKKQVVIILFSNSNKSVSLFSQITKLEPSFRFISAGFVPSDTLSLYLQASDFSLSTNPLLLIEKSASASVCLAHGLPVIITRNDIFFEGIKKPNPMPNVFFIEEKTPFNALEMKRRETSSNLDSVSKKMLMDLQLSTDRSK